MTKPTSESSLAAHAILLVLWQNQQNGMFAGRTRHFVGFVMRRLKCTFQAGFSVIWWRRDEYVGG